MGRRMPGPCAARTLPGAEKDCPAHGLVPVLNRLPRSIQRRGVAAGEAVGYNQSWVAPSSARIATVSLGYADGYLRSAGNRAAVRLDGVARPVVGRISMDTLTVDVTGVAADRLSPGTLFDVLDDVQDINALAHQAGTNAYEILTNLGARYRRQYLDNP